MSHMLIGTKRSSIKCNLTTRDPRIVPAEFDKLIVASHFRHTTVVQNDDFADLPDGG